MMVQVDDYYGHFYPDSEDEARWIEAQENRRRGPVAKAKKAIKFGESITLNKVI